jgi:hypothetical protein
MFINDNNRRQSSTRRKHCRSSTQDYVYSDPRDMPIIWNNGRGEPATTQ